MKKYFYILIFLIGINFTSTAQNKIATPDVTSAKQIKFYPNPASSVITFEFNKTGNDASQSLQVYNFMGKKVYDIKNAPSRVSINLEEFYRGIYIFQVRDKNGTISQTGKFQVVK